MEPQTIQGIILKGIGGFYYVEAADQIYECKPRGIFRQKKQAPLAGDHVCISLLDLEEHTGVIETILPRQNQLVRPPIANIDQLFILSSMKDPAPNILILDQMIALATLKGITPIVVLSKCDLASPEEIKSIYDLAGIQTICLCTKTGEGVEEVLRLLPGKISAFTGNSGVGKSSLLNCLSPELGLQTGETSQKLGRGRHTTREVSLYRLGSGTFVADTPGFSALETQRTEPIKKEDLQFAFSDFMPYRTECQFTSCSHVCEKGCAVLHAVEEGNISRSRHNSYVAMYEQAKKMKEWEIK